jgi:hypothetical protein
MRSADPSVKVPTAKSVLKHQTIECAAVAHWLSFVKMRVRRFAPSLSPRCGKCLTIARKRESL